MSFMFQDVARGRYLKTFANKSTIEQPMLILMLRYGSFKTLISTYWAIFGLNKQILLRVPLNLFLFQKNILMVF